ncbi:MAG: hypothetical protein KF760_02225 [Candidatus Eremiobacteraeota bacterium]|nr:hypothetical protein [Candidatus Eremiobacteraeota bacterium]MCW5871180.1 hypothetical protein [Candidatus Eremiobacteraeota bacterium]
MTSSENRALDNAMRRGYLVCRRDQRTLSDQYSQYCGALGLPVLRVDRHGRQSQVVLQWSKALPPFRHDQQCKLRGLLSEPDQPPGLLPIVFRYGAYSAFSSHEVAEELASLVASWIQEQF